MIIAIDGPAGAGKSTISARLAATIGFTRLDTGALYRAIAWSALEANLAAIESPELQAHLDALTITMDAGEVIIDERCPGLKLRSPQVSRAASDFATLPLVRAKLLELQRSLGRARDSILDGRDIGTIVFPDAELKLYLTASVEARAARRAAELEARGEQVSLQEVAREIEERDQQDKERPIAPLRCAEDAIVIDASRLSIDEVVQRCLSLALARGATIENLTEGGS